MTFDIEWENGTLIVTPLADLREMDYPDIETAAKEVIGLLESGAVKNFIVDFKNTDYYGSTALGFFVKLWKRVSERKGRMAFCNVSAHEREILAVTRLDVLWPICGSREQARKELGLS